MYQQHQCTNITNVPTLPMYQHHQCTNIIIIIIVIILMGASPKCPPVEVDCDGGIHFVLTAVVAGSHLNYHNKFPNALTMF
jgi:hypothetical protein